MFARHSLAMALLLGGFFPGVSGATDIEVRFDLESPARSPFPSNRFSEPEPANLSGIRVSLPMPDCSVEPSSCAEVEVLNTLDGFNLQPRLQLPFTGPIDLGSVDSSSVFLVKLGRAGLESDPSAGARVGIDQVVFEPSTHTLFAESAELLEQNTSYALIATRALQSARGRPVAGRDFQRFLAGRGSRRRGRDLGEYRAEVLRAIELVGLERDEVVGASVFTTLSATAQLEKIRAQLRAAPVPPVDFELGEDGSRTVFPLRQIGSLVFQRQVGTGEGAFRESEVRVDALAQQRAVETLAFGSYLSPDYLTADRVMVGVGTASGMPEPQAVRPVFFNLMLPRGRQPAEGWPVAIFGHGFGGEKNSALVLASSLAEMGIATASINVVGHGGGAEGALVVTPRARQRAAVRLPAGGRGMDLNGDGAIDGTEGVASVTLPLIDSRDGLRQTVVDLMQLVHVLRSGAVDVDGDGAGDFDPSRIFYSGISFGGIYGTILLAVENDIRAGVPNVGGGPSVDISRLSPNFRPLLAASLAQRQPSLLNAPMDPPQFGFDAALPLRGQPPVTNAVEGAIEIQELLDRAEWTQQTGSPVAYARHIRAEPLAGNQPKPIIFQFARGDQTVPNPTSTAIVRAGQFRDRVTLFRNDLFIDGLISQGADPNLVSALRNPHGFLALRGAEGAAGANAEAAQRQIAVFFASDGTEIIDPDEEAPLFETPIAGALPEDRGFITP